MRNKNSREQCARDWLSQIKQQASKIEMDIGISQMQATLLLANKFCIPISDVKNLQILGKSRQFRCRQFKAISKYIHITNKQKQKRLDQGKPAVQENNEQRKVDQKLNNSYFVYTPTMMQNYQQWGQSVVVEVHIFQDQAQLFYTSSANKKKLVGFVMGFDDSNVPRCFGIVYGCRYEFIACLCQYFQFKNTLPYSFSIRIYPQALIQLQNNNILQPLTSIFPTLQIIQNIESDMQKSSRCLTAETKSLSFKHLSNCSMFHETDRQWQYQRIINQLMAAKYQQDLIFRVLRKQRRNYYRSYELFIKLPILLLLHRQRRWQNSWKCVDWIDIVGSDEQMIRLGFQLAEQVYKLLIYQYIKSIQVLKITEHNKTETKISQTNNKKAQNLTLTYSIEHQHWSCPCNMLHKSGIPCRHLIKIIRYFDGNITYYINQRWIRQRRDDQLRSNIWRFVYEMEKKFKK